MVQQQLDVLEGVVAPQRVLKGRMMPPGHAVGVGAVLEQELAAVVIVPVGFAEQHGGEAVVAELPAVDQRLQGGVVVRLGSVVGRFLVIGIGAALEQQARQLRVVRDAGGAVQRALPLGVRPMIHLVPSGIGARTGVEQRRGGPYEAGRAGAIEPQVARETEVGERVPSAGPSRDRGVSAVKLEQTAHGRVVAQDRRRVDVRARDLGMRGENRLGAVECSRCVPGVERDAGGLDKGGERIDHFVVRPYGGLRIPSTLPHGALRLLR